MIVKRARTAGFCMGVSLALRTLDKAIESNPGGARICTLGPIIHNPQVLADYESQGVVCLQKLDTVSGRDIVVIRAHGVPRQDEELLKKSGATIVDATCPRVKKAQLAIARATQDGSSLLLFGEADHPEVRGLISYACCESHVFTDLGTLEGMELDPARSWVLASQTTQNAGLFAEIRAYLETRLPSLKVLSTICDATDERQEEALAIAGGVDAMVVVGGRQSGNTRRLASLASGCGITTYHVEDINELSREAFRGLSTIGLTAGASTPRALIDAAEAWLKDIR